VALQTLSQTHLLAKRETKRTTNENLDLLAQLLGAHIGFDQLLGDISRRSRPTLNGFIDEVDNVEVVGVFGLEVVEIFAEEDVGGGDVGVDEGEFCAVRGVREGVVDDLIEGGTAVYMR